ncbi:hypothetical protein CVT26_007397 [Gymnopilus dilepis]|uniref:Uncharacterized protein n=1 Tax=Gymnopilus dilepis TaxID=231916 RepID=A0A409XDM8_9AGAR|nr:hypothetical protein CVT26_007397 [Gymnopilus dilepis]
MPATPPNKQIFNPQRYESYAAINRRYAAPSSIFFLLFFSLSSLLLFTGVYVRRAVFGGRTGPPPWGGQTHSRLMAA